MSNTDVTDFEVCRTLIYHCIDSSLAKREELYKKGKINVTQYTERRQIIEEPLHRQAKDLTLEIYKGIVKDFTSHQAKIGQVTTKLQQVSQKIQDVNKSINFFTDIINFFGGILTTVSSGIAGIPTLLTNFEKILNRYP